MSTTKKGRERAVRKATEGLVMTWSDTDPLGDSDQTATFVGVGHRKKHLADKAERIFEAAFHFLKKQPQRWLFTIELQCNDGTNDYIKSVEVEAFLPYTLIFEYVEEQVERLLNSVKYEHIVTTMFYAEILKK